MRTKKVDYYIFLYKTQTQVLYHVPQVAGTVLDSHTGHDLYLIYFTHYTRVYHVRVNMYIVCIFLYLYLYLYKYIIIFTKIPRWYTVLTCACTWYHILYKFEIFVSSFLLLLCTRATLTHPLGPFVIDLSFLYLPPCRSNTIFVG